MNREASDFSPGSRHAIDVGVSPGEGSSGHLRDTIEPKGERRNLPQGIAAPTSDESKRL
jgi:hypothetical protein